MAPPARGRHTCSALRSVAAAAALLSRPAGSRSRAEHALAHRQILRGGWPGAAERTTRHALRQSRLVAASQNPSATTASSSTEKRSRGANRLVSLESTACTRTEPLAAQRTPGFTLIRGSRYHGREADVFGARPLPYSSLYLVTYRAPRAEQEKLPF